MLLVVVREEASRSTPREDTETATASRTRGRARSGDRDSRREGLHATRTTPGRSHGVPETLDTLSASRTQRGALPRVPTRAAGARGPWRLDRSRSLAAVATQP